MLVLTRKHRENIVISDHIKITVLRVKGNTVRLGIEAPDSVRIVRGELIEKTAVGASSKPATAAAATDAATTDTAGASAEIIVVTSTESRNGGEATVVTEEPFNAASKFGTSDDNVSKRSAPLGKFIGAADASAI